MSTQTNILTPTGRIVQGHCYIGNDKDINGLPLVNRQTQQPRKEWFIALAFSKTDPVIVPQFNEFWAILDAEAKKAWPNGEWQRPDFSWKWQDGDGVDGNGKPNNQKEGFAGHHILSFRSGFAPGVYDTDPNIALPWSPESNLPVPVRRGDYVRVSGTVAGNGNAQNPGLYLNLKMIQFVDRGQEIHGGPDAAEVFGTAVAVPADMVRDTGPAAAPGMTPGAAHPGAIPAASVATPGVNPAPAPAPGPGVTPAPAPGPGAAGPGAATPVGPHGTILNG